MDQAADIQTGVTHAEAWYSMIYKPVIASLGALLASAVSYCVLYVFGFNRTKEESQTIQLINYRLDIIDRLQKLGASYVDHYRIVQFHAIEQDIVKYIHARTRDVDFEDIKRRSFLVRYFLLPLPKGLFSMMVSMAYYWAGFIFLANMATILYLPFTEDGWYVEILLVPPAPIFLAMIAGLRRLAFRLRRMHEAKRFTVDAPTAAALAAG